MNINPLLLVAVELLAKSAGLLALAGLCALALRRASAAARHTVWFAAIVALLLLPLTKAAPPRWKLQPPAPAALHLEIPPAAATPAAAVTSSTVSTPPARHWQLPTWGDLALGAWALGALSLLGRHILGLIHLARLRHRSTPVADARVTSVFRRVTAGLARSVELRLLATAKVPVTWGLRRHVLLLPPHAFEWDDAQLEAALRHEVAHIARRDHLTRALAQVACALYWPNPLAWLAAGALRREQEHACDDLVLNAGTLSETYATLLLEAASLLQGAPPLPMGAVAMARPSTLEGRVLAIVDDTRDRRATGALTRWLAGGGVALGVGLCGAAQLLATDPRKVDAGPPIEIEAKFVEIAPEAAVAKENASWLTTGPGGAPLILSGERYGNVIATLSAQKGVDILAAPRVTARSGQRASISIGAEVPYGSAWEKEANGWKAKTMENRRVGVQLDLMPSLSADRRSISVMAEPSVTEFLGYFDQESRKWYGNPSLNPSVAELADAQAKVPAGVLVNPIFSAQKVVAQVSLAPGETAVISRLKRPTPPDEPVPNSRLMNRQLVVFVSARVVDDPAEPAGAAQPTALDRAAKIIIPRLEFKDATVRESIDFLRQKSVMLDPEKKGVNFILNAPAAELSKITLSLTNIPVSEAARYVAKLAGLSVTADRDAVVLEPPTLTKTGSGTLVLSGANTYTGTTKVNAGTLTINSSPAPESAAYKKARGLIIPKLDFRDASLAEGISFLRQKAVSLDPEHKGVNLVLNAPPGEQPKITISLTNVPLSEAVKYVAKLAGLGVSADEGAIVIGPAAAANVSAESKAATESAAAKKAKALILPKLEFREATVREGVDYFNAKARTLDPEQVGVNIVLATGAGADTKVSLSLSDISIYDALSYVAKLANLDLAADDHALTLQPSR